MFSIVVVVCYVVSLVCPKIRMKTFQSFKYSKSFFLSFEHISTEYVDYESLNYLNDINYKYGSIF